MTFFREWIVPFLIALTAAICVGVLTYCILKMVGA